MGVRISALGVPGFMHGKAEGKLEVGKGWSTVSTLNETQRATLRDFHGRFIQVHPADRDQLGAFGLGFVSEDKPLVDRDAKKSDATSGGTGKPTTTSTTPKHDAGAKADAKKSDATSGGK